MGNASSPSTAGLVFWIGTEIAREKTYVSGGQEYDGIFKTNSNPSNFVFYANSTTANFLLANLSLREIYDGSLNVYGNATVDRLYQRDDHPHMFGLVTQPQTVGTINIWHNVTFNASISIVEGDFTFLEDNQTLVVNEAGDYYISMECSFTDSDPAANNQIAIRVAKNNNILNGTYSEQTSQKTSDTENILKQSYAELLVGDRLQFQYISDSTTVSINSVNTWNTGMHAIASGWIERID
jgi:hypothetical protein